MSEAGKNVLEQLLREAKPKEHYTDEDISDVLLACGHVPDPEGIIEDAVTVIKQLLRERVRLKFDVLREENRAKLHTGQYLMLLAIATGLEQGAELDPHERTLVKGVLLANNAYAKSVFPDLYSEFIDE